MAASIRTGWAMTRSARLGSRRWALRWCGCGITSSLRIGTRRGSGSWRGLRGGGGRWWVAGFVGVGLDGGRLGRRLVFRPHPGPLALGPAALAGEGVRLGRWLLFRPHPGPLPRGRGGRRGWLGPALSLVGRGSEGVAAGPLVALPPSPRPSPSRERGSEGVAAGPLSSALTPALSPRGRGGKEGVAAVFSALTPALSLAGEGGVDCPSCCVLLTSCATLMSSRTRGVIASYAFGIPT